MSQGEILQLKGLPEGTDLAWRCYRSRWQPIVVFDANGEQHFSQFILFETDGISFGIPVQVVDITTREVF